MSEESPPWTLAAGWEAENPGRQLKNPVDRVEQPKREQQRLSLDDYFLRSPTTALPACYNLYVAGTYRITRQPGTGHRLSPCRDCGCATPREEALS